MMETDPQSGRYRVPTPYEAWVQRQGIPVVEGYGLSDWRQHEMGHWERLGCPAYFVTLKGMEGITGMYVAEIPAGGTTNREHHLYEKIIYILDGSGSTTLEDSRGKTTHFEWGQGSLFAIPLNTPHRLFATGQPVRYIAFTTAPLVFDLFYDEEFVYNDAFRFRDRFDGEAHFLTLDQRYQAGARDMPIWETNFIPDIRTALVDRSGVKGADVHLTQFEIAGNSLIGHLAKWPIGRYHKAHHHGGGAILLDRAVGGLYADVAQRARRAPLRARLRRRGRARSTGSRGAPSARRRAGSTSTSTPATRPPSNWRSATAAASTRSACGARRRSAACSARRARAAR